MSEQWQYQVRIDLADEAAEVKARSRQPGTRAAAGHPREA
jgi:hypothetical protein